MARHFNIGLEKENISKNIYFKTLIHQLTSATNLEFEMRYMSHYVNYSIIDYSPLEHK